VSAPSGSVWREVLCSQQHPSISRPARGSFVGWGAFESSVVRGSGCYRSGHPPAGAAHRGSPHARGGWASSRQGVQTRARSAPSTPQLRITEHGASSQVQRGTSWLKSGRTGLHQTVTVKTARTSYAGSCHAFECSKGIERAVEKANRRPTAQQKKNRGTDKGKPFERGGRKAADLKLPPPRRVEPGLPGYRRP